jgi:hypothetical protein
MISSLNGSIILKWNLGKIGWDGVDWIHLAQDRDPCEYGN